MRLVVQRVSEAAVSIGGSVHASIGKGLCVLVGVTETDTEEDVLWLAAKVTSMRIFGDDQDKMNLSVQDIGGEILVISQFTLHATTKKGNRPSFISAARPEKAIQLYQLFLTQLEANLGKSVSSGVFGADMNVSLINQGPVTILMDSKVRE